MNKQTLIDRHEFSKLRKQLADLIEEAMKLAQIFMPMHPLLRGTVYELKRKCGKPPCPIVMKVFFTQEWVLSSSEKGKTRLRVIPVGMMDVIRSHM
jgi:hypothetical protein